MISSVRHMGIVVRDLERSLAFYTGTLGFQVQARDRETGSFISRLVGIPNVDVEWVKMTAPGGGMVELLQYHSHPDGSPVEPAPSNKVANGHLALTVTDLDALYASLKAQNLPTQGAPQTAPHGKVKVLYAYDPDGVILELVEELSLPDRAD